MAFSLFCAAAVQHTPREISMRGWFSKKREKRYEAILTDQPWSCDGNNEANRGPRGETKLVNYSIFKIIVDGIE